MNSDNKKFLPLLVLILLAIIWGSSFILIKKGLDVYSPDQVGTIRIVFAFLVMLPIAVKHIRTIFKTHWKIILPFGLVANLIPALLFALAETGLSSSVTGILNSLTPIFTLIIGALFFSTGIQKSQIAGLVIGFIGSLTLSFIGSSGSLGEFNYFALFVVAATICYGLSGNMVRKFFLEINSVILTSLAMFSIGPISLIYLLTTDFTYTLLNVEGAWTSLGYLFILGAVGTAFALILFNRVIQTTSAVFASTVTYLIPIAAVIWGLIDNETLYPLHYVGMALIILGVYVINKNK
jgi:drug/metabolite transporter (DMT)-like permease